VTLSGDFILVKLQAANANMKPKTEPKVAYWFGWKGVTINKPKIKAIVAVMKILKLLSRVNINILKVFIKEKTRLLWTRIS
jgi:hypothetical protein